MTTNTKYAEEAYAKLLLLDATAGGIESWCRVYGCTDARTGHNHVLLEVRRNGGLTVYHQDKIESIFRGEKLFTLWEI